MNAADHRAIDRAEYRRHLAEGQPNADAEYLFAAAWSMAHLARVYEQPSRIAVASNALKSANI